MGRTNPNMGDSGSLFSALMVPLRWLTFRRLETICWWGFVLLPLFFGWLHYNWLPNESFDKRRLILFASHEVCEGGWDEACGDMADVWEDKLTGQRYYRTQFASHRASERWRLLAVDFGYGLIGCFLYALFRLRYDRNALFDSLGRAIALNTGVCLLAFLLFR